MPVPIQSFRFATFARRRLDDHQALGGRTAHRRIGNAPHRVRIANCRLPTPRTPIFDVARAVRVRIVFAPTLTTGAKQKT